MYLTDLKNYFILQSKVKKIFIKYSFDAAISLLTFFIVSDHYNLYIALISVLSSLITSYILRHDKEIFSFHKNDNLYKIVLYCLINYIIICTILFLFDYTLNYSFFFVNFTIIYIARNIIKKIFSLGSRNKNIVIICNDFKSIYFNNIIYSSKLNVKKIFTSDIKFVDKKINNVNIVDLMRFYKFDYINIDQVVVVGEINNIFLRKLINFCVRINVPIIGNKINYFNEDSDYSHFLDRENLDFLYHDNSNILKNKNILITGAGGSIGSELVRQIVNSKPKSVILLDHSEFNLYKIYESLSKSNIKIIPILMSIGSPDLINVFTKFKIDVIYHAAAYKHVPMVENNVLNGIYNNFICTKRLIDIAVNFNVSKFVFISTDKAVNPTNVMGATKRLCEIYIQSTLENNNNTTKFSIVRFGNVLGSSGSVIPLFKSQILSGGPITITNFRVNRFFMTIPEAVNLILSINEIDSTFNNGSVYVLDMGNPVYIYELAKKMIVLSGHAIGSGLDEIDIIETGLRPGEKMYEELFLGDNIVKTTHNRILVSVEPYLRLDNLTDLLNSFEKYINNNELDEVFNLIKVVIPSFSHNLDIKDWRTQSI